MFYNKSESQLPKFHLNGVELEYVNVYKYLGYMYNSKMNDEDHIKSLLSKIRLAILQNKRYFKKANPKLLVRIAKSFIVSKLYGLEFSKSISANQLIRYNYLFNMWFSRGTEDTTKIMNDNKEINLEYLHKKARDRFDNLWRNDKEKWRV